MRKGKIALLLAVSLALSLLSGCWSAKSITDLAFVMGVAVDMGELEGQFEVTVQIANPNALKGGSEGRSSGDGEAYENYSAIGIGIDAPIELISRKINRNLYPGHNQVILISREVAEYGITPIIDFFIRSADGRYTVTLLVIDGKAKDALSMPSGLEPLPSMYLRELINAQIAVGDDDSGTVINFLKAALSDTSSPTLPMLTYEENEEGEKMFFPHGNAVFHDGTMIGSIEPRETRAMITMTGNVGNGSLQVQAFDGYVSLRILSVDSVYVPIFDENDKFDHMEVKLNLKCSIIETNTDTDFLDEEIRQDLANKTAEQLCLDMRSVLETSQELNADIFGFGSYLYQHHPRKTRNLLGGWNVVYPNLDVFFFVDVEILSAGSIIAPFEKGQETDR